ncbi:MAG TPA: gluconate 2-dehydrogenase subunit 3 family protein [Stellaceae bacterium]|nr:gluconate 2-dehydrogenase subunit 3 family protein [Stellaceae bacterium]
MPRPNRRVVLSSMAAALAASPLAHAELVEGGMPWTPDRAAPPTAVDPRGWRYFTAAEAKTVEALVDRLIPPDPETPGGKDCGCAVFIDRQLAGPYGKSEALYMKGPFHEGTHQQGPQSADPPAVHYRKALAALDKYCRATFGGSTFAALPDDKKDAVIADLESGKVPLGGKPGTFFKQLLKDTQQGFFADPVYGGNRDMAAWKMIGFPGARYDYSDWVDRHNEPYPHPPVSIGEHPDWKG